MRLHRDERGQTIILVALSLPFMLGFVGMATDVGALFKDKRTIQTAADAAAIAGALNLRYGSYVTTAKNASTANGYTDGSNGVTVTVKSPPVWASSNYYNKADYVEATVTKVEPTIFLSVFGFPSVTVTARAVATDQGPGDGCMYTLGTTGNDIHIQGSAEITATSCGMLVNSSSSNAITQTGNGPNLYARFRSIGVVGDPSGIGNYSPTPITGIAQVSDPLSYFPNYSCNNNACGCSGTPTIPCTGYPYSSAVICGNASGATLSPGCYKGLNGTYTLSSGTYLINGKIDGNITGSGVTLILISNSIETTGSKAITLTAPLASSDPSGTNPFDGIVIYQVPSDTTATDMKGNSTLNAQGVIYMPTAEFEMEGSTGGTIYADFVVSSIDIQGTPNIYDYQALAGVQSPITSINLVE
ncbi:MAG TPA: pilus assembly protein TadG-related protein [Acidobacteriaceae bacterium]|nr:pilus assembly protein TadG-related protein [Acidobacteriaceae bacterium]